MKYQPTFDQVASLDLGIGVEDGLLLDMIVSAPVWVTKKITEDGNEYYYLAQTKIIEDLPTVFKSKPAVTRAVKRLRHILDYTIVGRCNYYRVDKRLSEAWGKKNKGEDYQQFLVELLRKRNSSESGTIPETELKGGNSSESGTKTVPKVEPIHQLTNPPINNKPTIGRFVRPSLESCKDYLTEIGADKSSIDDHANGFLDHFESVGWVVGTGGNPMKDWKGALRGWVRRSSQFGQGQKSGSGKKRGFNKNPNYTDSDYGEIRGEI